MAQLRQDHASFEAHDAEIAVVGPESADAFAKYWRDERLPFTGLPNPDHSVLKLYGQEVKLFKLGRMPAQVLVDMRGRIRYVHYGHAMSDIPSTIEVLELLDKIEAEHG